jgi:hypothetical protein
MVRYSEFWLEIYDADQRGALWCFSHDSSMDFWLENMLMILCCKP